MILLFPISKVHIYFIPVYIYVLNSILNSPFSLILKSPYTILSVLNADNPLLVTSSYSISIGRSIS